jgi:shikimate kinase
MGSGKTRVAKALERALGWQRIDTDQEIERRLGMSVAEIFSRLGEARFREEEKKLIAELGTKKNAIVSLGGGSLLQAENLEMALRSGVLVYLDVPLETCLERAKRKTGARPLLAGVADVSNLFRAREPGYVKAHWRVDAETAQSEDVATAILNRHLKEKTEGQK